MNLIIYSYLRLIFLVRHWLFKKFTLAGLGVLVCLIVSAIVGLGSTQSMTHLIFFLSLALLGVEMLGTRYVNYRFQVHRLLPRFGTLRVPLKYRLVLKNLSQDAQQGLTFVEIFSETFPSFSEFQRIKKRYPKRRQCRKHWRRRVAQQQWAISHPKTLPMLPPKITTEVIGQILPIRRGRLCLEGIAISCPGPLGLIYKHLNFDIPDSIFILPKRYQLPALKLASARHYQMGDAILTSSVGDALEFRSLRDYRPGDPTNKIHWKSWAKVGRPMTKEQQDESAVHHALIVDTFQTEAHSAIFEEAISVAVSYLMQDNPEESLLDIIFSSQKPQCITVGKGLEQREKIIETLAMIAPCREHSINTLNPILQTRISRLSGCICIFLNFEETRQKFLKNLIQSGIPTKTIILCQKKNEQYEVADYFRSLQSNIHFISMGQIQQDLLKI